MNTKPYNKKLTSIKILLISKEILINKISKMLEEKYMIFKFENNI